MRFQLSAKELTIINHDTWQNLETASLTQLRFLLFFFQRLHEAIFVPEEKHTKELKVLEGSYQTPVYMTAL